MCVCVCVHLSQRNACEAVVALARHHQHVLGVMGFVAAVTTALRQYPLHPELQAAACLVLASLLRTPDDAHLSIHAANRELAIQAEAPALVLQALSAHLLDAKVCRAACMAMVTLATGCVASRRSVGRSVGRSVRARGCGV